MRDTDKPKEHNMDLGTQRYVLDEADFVALVCEIRKVTSLYGAPGVPPSRRGGPKQEADRIHPSLTAREQETLIWTTEGFTASEIATQLGISRRTVEKHREHVMHKLGVRNKVGLVRYALQHAPIPTTPSPRCVCPTPSIGPGCPRSSYPTELPPKEGLMNNQATHATSEGMYQLVSFVVAGEEFGMDILIW